MTALVEGEPNDGAVAIAAITSCTNTSDPRLLIAAGLVARKACAFGLRPPRWGGDLDGARIAHSGAVFETRGTSGRSLGYRFRHRRIRLHYLHRELGPNY